MTKKKSLGDMRKNKSQDDSSGTMPASFNKIEGNKLHINVDFLREQNVFFATPCYGGLLTDQYFLSMFRIQQELIKLGMKFRITTLRNESLVPRARNILTAMFLESDCSHLFFIDADIEFDPESVIRAVAYDKPILAAAYPKKTLPINYAVNFKIIDPKLNRVNIQHGAVEVHDASTGFFCVKRHVLEEMMVAYPKLHYKNDSSIDVKFNKYCYALFDTGLDPVDNRYLSEDYYFCRLWQKLGGQIWLDPHTKLNHIGSYSFEGDISKILQWNNEVPTIPGGANPTQKEDKK